MPYANNSVRYERHQERRRHLFASGLCLYCGKNKAVKKRAGCVECLHKKSRHHAVFAKKNPDKIKKYRLMVKKEVLTKYGGKCACCGEHTLVFLAIDHINNDGYLEPNRRQEGSHKWYLKLRRIPLREDLQVSVGLRAVHSILGS